MVHKLGEKEYLKIIMEAMAEEYGNTLWEGDTDLAMAKKILKELREFLYFHPMDMGQKEWKKFLRDRKA